ncbi:MAG: hypothetical protein RIR62_2916 [Pseudomonadota bacterium]
MLWLNDTKFAAAPRITVAEGVYASTRLAGADGWLRAGDVKPGDQLLTFDAGLLPVLHVHRHRIAPDAPVQDWPILIPAGTLGTHEALRLPPEQTVLVEADLAEELYSEAFVSVPALALEGWRGCTRVPPPDEDVMTITLETAQLVYAGNDLLVGLAGQPTLNALLQGDMSSAVPLGPSAARHLIACMIAEEAGAELRRAAMGAN